MKLVSVIKRPESMGWQVVTPQLMGRAVRPRHTSFCNDKLEVQNMEVHLISSTIALRGTR